jgi:hypothetical protein
MSLLKVVQGVSQSPLLPLGTLLLILQQVMEALGFQLELVDTNLKKKVALLETVMPHYSLL